MTKIDEYLSKVESEKRVQLERIRDIAKSVVPGATEDVSYGMPTLKVGGKSFIGFNTCKEHIGIYPFGGKEIEIFKNELLKLDYGFSKGSIRVPYEQPIPTELLKNIIQHRINRIVHE